MSETLNVTSQRDSLTSREKQTAGAGQDLPILEGAVPVSQADLGEVPLLARLIQEQQQLSAVDQFARDCSAGEISRREKTYARLLPTQDPQPGQQYAFEVDLDCCSGCKACVTACHSLNGLDPEETWRHVGLLVGGTTQQPVMQHVTTACHHCLDPPCMVACPVDAYEKHPVTGIVKHLDDQCFGCQYCTLACPYDVPRYHKEKGIVRKCDLCADRLADGEPPACVQACPHEAISITLVDTELVRENAEADHFLPAAPEPHVSFPTTSYRTTRVFPKNLLPVDYYSVSPQHPHVPLIVMLVLTQLSVGAFLCGLLLERFSPAKLPASFEAFQATNGLLFGLLALAASTLHLGRPWYAFRGLVGLRHSWLSREILAFGLFAVSASLYAFSAWQSWVPFLFSRTLAWSVAVWGILGLFSSAMIYAFTQREFWSLPRTLVKFGLTASLLGPGATWLTLLIMRYAGDDFGDTQEMVAFGRILSKALLITGGLKMMYEGFLFKHLWDRRMTPLRRSAMLMIGPLSGVAMARYAAGFLGGIAMPLLLLTSLSRASDNHDTLVLVAVALGFIACLTGEFLERYLFFAAVAAPRMPGGPRP